jgi:hypothetical protein
MSSLNSSVEFELEKKFKGFQAVRAGFASGNFVYGLFVASAIPNA